MKNKFTVRKSESRNLKGLSLLVLLIIIGTTISCTSQRKVIDDDFAVDSAEAGLSDEDLMLDSSDAPVESAAVPNEAKDEFSDFDGAPAVETNATAASNTAAQNENDSVANLEKELNDLSDAPAAEIAVPAPEVAQTAPEVNPEPAIITPPPEVVATTPEPPAPEIVAPQITEVPVAAPPVSKITGIKYKGNSNGGTVVIDSDSPLNYTTRVNSSANQVVVEVQDTIVANQFKRPLNTKDMSSSIGHVDVYQKKDSKTARFVIQLRPNSPEPLVQPEGNSLLIIGSALEGSGPNPKLSTSYANNDITNSDSFDSVSNSSNNTDINTEMAAQGIMSSDDLEEFLTNNNKFYGNKISIETTDMDVRDILKFISEESGVNMIFDDDISGKSSLKLRKVPWDQALVILLKSKKFGFRRQGSILRIAKLESLIKEDESAVKLKESKSVIEPLVVRNFSINYADIEKLETKIKDFITETKRDANTRGRVTSDTRTNMLIVTETESKLEQIAQLIKALDTQPQQVMIEARIIEASDKYMRSIGGQIGVNRNSVSGLPISPGPTSTIPNFTTGRVAVPSGINNYESHGVNITPSKNIGQTGSFLGNMFFGTLGAFGNLDAQLALDEIEDRVKILSSPRVVVLTNTSATINQGATILQKSTSSTPAAGGPTTETFVPTKIGVNLKVTPQVSNIGTVRLQLDVSRTSLSSLGDSSIDDRNVKTEVIVKSGDTAVIGGVFQSDVLKTKSGVPGLKDIPILGTLFKGEVSQNNKVELMIFITPKIIPLLNQVFKAENEANVQESNQ